MTKLKRLRQCEKCPWKLSTNPYDIPDGYSLDRHKELLCTIAVPGSLDFLSDSSIYVMSCHEHASEDNVHCVGWLMNQLGPGNNIGLRVRMLGCENINDVQLDGPQHESFEDTLP